MIDDIHTILLETNEHDCVSFVNQLRSLCETLIIKTHKDTLKRLWVLEQASDFFLEASELQSGFTSEFQGKLKISVKSDHVKTETAHFWLKSSGDFYEILD